MTSPTLAYSSNGLQTVSLTEAIRKISSYGFYGIELLIDHPHWVDTRKNKKYISEIQRALKNETLLITNLNANDCYLLGNDHVPNLRPINPEDSVRQTLLDWHKHCLELSHTFDGPAVSLATGPLPERSTSIQAMDRLKFHIDSLLKRAEQLNVPFTIEFEPDHLIDSWASLKGLISEFDHPLFGVNLDIGHIACANEDIFEVTREAFPKVYNIHFEDIKEAIHEHLVPGTGDLPLSDYLGELEKLNYHKGLTVELYNHSSHADKALEGTVAFFSEHRAHWLKSKGRAS